MVVALSVERYLSISNSSQQDKVGKHIPNNEKILMISGVLLWLRAACTCVFYSIQLSKVFWIFHPLPLLQWWVSSYLGVVAMVTNANSAELEFALPDSVCSVWLRSSHLCTIIGLTRTPGLAIQILVWDWSLATTIGTNVRHSERRPSGNNVSGR